jgi:hypothetical protein
MNRYRPSPNAIYRSAHRNEAELRAEIRAALRQLGWQVVDTSQDRVARGGLRSFPDLWCARQDRTLLIETKHGRNDLSAGQREFADQLAAHTGPHLIYCCARSVDDVLQVLGVS